MTNSSSVAEVSADTILDIWNIVNKILQQQTSLESWMKGGFMNIAKARQVERCYSMVFVVIMFVLLGVLFTFAVLYVCS